MAEQHLKKEDERFEILLDLACKTAALEIAAIRRDQQFAAETARRTETVEAMIEKVESLALRVAEFNRTAQPGGQHE